MSIEGCENPFKRAARRTFMTVESFANQTSCKSKSVQGRSAVLRAGPGRQPTVPQRKLLTHLSLLFNPSAVSFATFENCLSRSDDAPPPTPIPGKASPPAMFELKRVERPIGRGASRMGFKTLSWEET